MLYDPTKNETVDLPTFALRSGPRKTIYHNPKDVTAAIVTCEPSCQPGGLLQQPAREPRAGLGALGLRF